MAWRLAFLIFFTWSAACKPSVSGSAPPGKKDSRALNVQDFLEAYRKEPAGQAMLIDLRTPPEFEDGFIPGAVMINYLEDDIDLQLGRLDKSKTYYIYCQQEGRSVLCIQKMENMGFKKVYLMKGGYDAFLLSGPN